jgi:hypothetical protein
VRDYDGAFCLKPAKGLLRPFQCPVKAVAFCGEAILDRKARSNFVNVPQLFHLVITTAGLSLQLRERIDPMGAAIHGSIPIDRLPMG